MNVYKNTMIELTAVYPGTFDPFTRGHEDLVRRASKLWPKVIVGVAMSYHKKTMFTNEERLEMAIEVLQPYENVEVASFSGLLKHFVESKNASVIVRGLRAVSDFEYEFQMSGMNRHLMPQVESVFLTPGLKYHFVSSTLVREVAVLGGDVSELVSPAVAKRLEAKRLERLADENMQG